MSDNDKFEWFGWGEDPIGKYKQPKPNTSKPGSGYPQTDIMKDGVMVKGRWPSGTLTKSHKKMRGAGAATQGYNYTTDPDSGEE